MGRTCSTISTISTVSTISTISTASTVSTRWGPECTSTTHEWHGRMHDEMMLGSAQAQRLVWACARVVCRGGVPRWRAEMQCRGGVYDPDSCRTVVRANNKSSPTCPASSVRRRACSRRRRDSNSRTGCTQTRPAGLACARAFAACLRAPQSTRHVHATYAHTTYIGAV